MIVPLISFYFVWSGLEWTFDIGQWGWFGRGLYVICSMIWLFFTGLIIWSVIQDIRNGREIGAGIERLNRKADEELKKHRGF